MTTGEIRVPDVWDLTWPDLDPAGRPGFDPAAVPALVRALPPAAEIPSPGTEWQLVSIWYTRMTAALMDRLGRWAAGWRCSGIAMEEEGNGPVPIWRGIDPVLSATPDETLDRLAAAVVTWHELLVELATDARGRFATSAPATTDSTGEPPAWRVVTGRGRILKYTGDRLYRQVPHPGGLTWADVDPANRSFDPATVPATVADRLAEFPPPPKEADWRLRDLWLERISRGLADRYGIWAVGWRWSVGEGDLDGGPVANWCCFSHSVTTAEATAALIVASLVEWHDWLVELAGRFDRFLPLPPGDLDGWEYAVAHLVTAVGDRTQYDSAWYSCVGTVLDWFLEAAGIGDPARREELREHAVGGRFESWREPRRAVVESVAADLSARVADEHA
ncbi:hypothetical protein [Actinoplanes sp. L3-i22]|uniref:hypothetical protein n=1 Tax=Actinoplanes sp. L3-i22 TaxID=2836373 RepID=UPI001C76279B|nr:hypothetical protein [Actinoplanes sp. L3-i22]BCY06489.1 hypothetical protein L3i22_015770 [Actinoplanes sp. L3-i22]